MDTSEQTPWYRRARRWGQTNLTELDPTRYDDAFWRSYWKRTRVQGVIVNAGGIVAYYPSKFPLHYRAAKLGDRDLFGDIVRSAREEGLAVLARMDSNRADQRFYDEYPDWFAHNRDGEPARAQGRFLACVTGPYYAEYLPSVLQEIIERYHPDGFTDNSWTGPRQNFICHCDNCRTKFRRDTGHELPPEKDWDNPVYRAWVKWSFQCRTEIWDRFNETTRRAGGPDCLWLGMLHGDPITGHLSFGDLKELGERSAIVMTDQQSRTPRTGFEQNGLTGKLLHGVAGWETVIPESMAMYVRGEQTFRVGSNPPEESRTWMISGFAGGISPWWHHVSAKHEDKRQYKTALPLMEWHEKNEQYLYDRTPIANIGIVWSHENGNFYGRDDSIESVLLPWLGFTRAMTRGRIPYLPVHADHIERERPRLLILPALGALSDRQCSAVREHVEQGGSLIASGRIGFLDENGDDRSQAPLDGLFDIRLTGDVYGPGGPVTGGWENHAGHNYMRLDPEYGEKPGDAPEKNPRHPVFQGFDDADILPLGCTIQGATPGSEATVLATCVPAFPIYPPEFSWSDDYRSAIPVVLCREHPSGGRLVYFAADIDRAYGKRALPDHGQILQNAVRWALRDDLPLQVEGPGYLDCHLYRQQDRLVLHLVNLSGCNAWPGYVEERYPVGPITVSVRLPEGVQVSSARCLVSGERHQTRSEGERIIATIPSVESHEVVVLGP